MDAPAMTALAPWFGGKRTLAPQIIEALGPHKCYWEPFCGSMAVLLNKPPVSMETANDLHGDLTNLARVVKEYTSAVELYDRLHRTIAAEGLFRESLAVIRSADASAQPCVERAYHYFLVSWLGMNGLAGSPNYSTQFARRFTSNGGDAAGRFRGAVESLPWWHKRLRNVFILQDDGLDLVEKIHDQDGTAIYCDPPYLVKGAKYLHDFADADHERLAAALAKFTRARVVVSYYEHPDLDRLYPGWHRIDVKIAKSLVNAGKRPKGRVEAPEVLIVNQVESGLFA